jgi:predicted ribosome quality control (RQC) complex YloA/Tae2 family protein
LEGAFVLDVVLPQFDRVAELLFSGSDGEKLRLVAELMGRNANLILVSGANTVLGAIRPVPADTVRSLQPGTTYAPPPGYRDRVDPSTLRGIQDAIFTERPRDPKDAKRWLGDTFSGIGKFAAEEIMVRSQRSSVPEALIELMRAVREQRFAPCDLVAEDGSAHGVWAFLPQSQPPERVYPRENIAVALDTFYMEMQIETVESDVRGELARRLDRELAFRRKELASAQATVREAARADEYEQRGNNLLAGMHLIGKGLSEVVVPDLYSETGEGITVTLNPELTPQENAESYFIRARKARAAVEYATGQVVDRSHEIALLTTVGSRLQNANADEFREIRREMDAIVGEERATAKPSSRATSPRKFEGHKIRTFMVDGYTLLIGETAEANDYLTTRIASPSDWWFHVRSAPGAHGVLRTEGKPDRVPDPVIRRAASIVAARSGTAIKHSGIVAVDVVEKRYVRKLRGGKPGMVTYERERTLDVEPSL